MDARGDLVTTERIVEREAAALGSAKGLHVPHRSERLRKVPRQRAYVEPFATVHVEVDFLPFDAADFYAVQLDLANRRVDVFSAASTLVKRPPTHLDGAYLVRAGAASR